MSIPETQGTSCKPLSNQPPLRARITDLRQLTALTLLNRLPTAALGVNEDGNIVYANPAFAELLGYEDASAITRLRQPELLAGHEAHGPTDCLSTLRSTTSTVEWNHRQHYVIQTVL